MRVKEWMHQETRKTDRRIESWKDEGRKKGWKGKATQERLTNGILTNWQQEGA